MFLCMFIEKRPQDQRGGYLIDHLVVFLAGTTSFVENLMSFVRGQAFIPHVNRQARQFAQFCRKGLSLGGLGTEFARHMQWIPDDDPHGGKTPCQPRQRAQVIPLIAVAFQGKNRLYGQPQLV